ncbi:unnamed protein product [Echinostoma caproni]|uniref:Homeobox domain-containing protein n=1 Tax=Echinostoma caproni TaxID=27848 RepID=A0A183A817_9TREM|nr:unnamed protein product [Echinostoma caproni]
MIGINQLVAAEFNSIQSSSLATTVATTIGNLSNAISNTKLENSPSIEINRAGYISGTETDINCTDLSKSQSSQSELSVSLCHLERNSANSEADVDSLSEFSPLHSRRRKQIKPQRTKDTEGRLVNIWRDVRITPLSKKEKGKFRSIALS